MRAALLICFLFASRVLAVDYHWIWELDEQMHRLGKFGDPEWDEFRDNPVTAPSYMSTIPVTEPNPIEWTLFIRQRDVKLFWPVRFNEKTLTNLFVSEDDLVSAFPIPAGTLTNPATAWDIRAPIGKDDIVVGEFRFDRRPLRVALADGQVTLRVREKGTPIPCRVTIVDKRGSLFPVLVDAKHAAVRPGVVYLGDGEGVIKFAEGDYTIFVGRGFEYGVSTNQISIKPGSKLDLNVEIKREVDTTGFVACDTHVHTFTYSRHGDATDEERAITLAGEGIELPIATDHNVIIDPITPAKNTGMDKYYTPVFGDEVTTGHAHFNVFPLEPNAKPPDWTINDWPKLMTEMRAAPGAKVVILNHPRNIHNRFQPFASTNFNARTGQNLRGFEFTFDAVEVLNSSALQSDWMIIFHDWMALLNYGYRVTGVGSSDVHDVSRYIVGQGRSYVACDDRDVAHIDVNKACDSFLAGRVLVSMGLLTDMVVDGHWRVGDLATNVPNEIDVTVTVQGPAWTAVDQVQLFANGEMLEQEKFEPVYTPGVKKKLTWKIPRASGVPSDFYLVAIASGPGVTQPFWRIPKPYQPTSTTWIPRVVGATNPIRVDADGDGVFTPLRLQQLKRTKQNAD